MIIQNKTHLDSVLEEHMQYENINVYAIVKYSNIEELIMFTKYLVDDKPYYLEAPIVLLKYECKTKDINDVKQLVSYLEEKYDTEDELAYKYMFQELEMAINKGYIYELDAPQTGPFLPKDRPFELEIITEKMALEYMIERDVS